MRVAELHFYAIIGWRRERVPPTRRHFGFMPGFLRKGLSRCPAGETSSDRNVVRVAMEPGVRGRTSLGSNPGLGSP